MRTPQSVYKHVPARRNAILAARRWLDRAASTRELDALRRFGLMLCENILTGYGIVKTINVGLACLPAPAVIVQMDRAELLDLMQAIHMAGFAPRMSASGRVGDSQSAPVNVHRLHRLNRSGEQAATAQHYARTIGGLALSFARVGDAPAVARLLRASAALELDHAWLTEAESYLLEQQGPDGRFGLMLSELSSLKMDRSEVGPWLRLTVEVLWALAERQSVTGTTDMASV